MEISNAATAVGGGSHVPFYISDSDEDDEHAAFVDSYSPDDIEIQEAILISIVASRAAIAASAPGSSHRPTTNVSAALESSSRDRKGKRKISTEVNSKKKRSNRDHFDCSICFEKVQVSEKFPVTNCSHAFCNSCVGRYVAAKIAENVARIGCPDPECKKGSVEIDHCQDIIPSELFDRWSVTLCEDVVGGDKVYCPFKDCSALLINDGAVKIRETECPHCHRLFCARCHAPWHPEIKCKEFKKHGDDEKGNDDLTLKNLANKKKWQRCPKCKMYVSRRSGCLLIHCRCGQYFCYNCAAPMKSGIHYCSNCRH